MKIMKFGGASVADSRCILYVAQLIKNYARDESIVIVVSAVKGVTDRLIAIYQKAQKNEQSKILQELSFLYHFHKDIFDHMELDQGLNKLFQKRLKELFAQLLICIVSTDYLTPCSYDYFVSFGEKLSCFLLVSALEQLDVAAQYVDSSKLIVTTDEFGNARPMIAETETNAQKILLPLVVKRIIPVMTGFYGATADGRVAILGRGGSDYSATILAHVLDASEVILWKEVDGIYSCDPKKDKDAQFFSEITYAQALKLAQNGAKVLHPEAMWPVAEKEIVVWVKNTFKPHLKGSKIWKGNV